MDQPAVHFAADPIGGVAQDMDFAAPHLAADVAAAIAVYKDAARLHFGANPVNAAQIAFPFVRLVRRVASDGKKLSQMRLDVAFEDLELFDFRQWLATHGVGRDAFDLQWHGGFRAEREAERHGEIELGIGNLGFRICG
jgi:hypothetical protein